MFKRALFLSLCGTALLGPPVFAQGKTEKLTELIQKLQTGNDAAKLAAAVALADFGPDAEPAVPALVQALQAKSEDLRLNAALALGKIGAPAVAPVAKLIGSGNASERYYAIWTLGWIGPPAKATAPQIIEALADKDEAVRRKAAFTLGRIAPEPKVATPPLIKLLADPSKDVRQAASDSLGKFGPAAVSPLIEALKDDAPMIRIEAARALGNIGSDAKDAIPALKTLFLTDAKASSDAGAALAKIGKASIPALTDALKSDKTDIRARAVKMLGVIGADAVPVLVDALADAHVDVRQHAAQELAPLRISDKLVVLALAHAVHDPDQTVRLHALRALQMLGAGAKLAAPKLIAALKDSDGPNRVQILTVLQGLGETEHIVPVAADLLKDKSVPIRLSAVNLLSTQGNPALPHLIAALKDEDVSVRTAAVIGIQRIPGDIKEALPALVTLLKEGTPFQRRSAVTALGRVGEQALPTLLECLKDGENSVRSAAVLALRGMGPGAKKAVPTLAEMALNESNTVARRNAVLAIATIDPDKLTDLFANVKKHNDEKVRQSAYQALSFPIKKGMVSTIPAKVCLPILLEATKDSAALIRQNAVQGIGRLGADAKDAVPAVTALLDDPDARVRQAAQIALNQIKPK